MQVNRFAMSLPTRQEIVRDNACATYLRHVLHGYLAALGVEADRVQNVARKLLVLAAGTDDDPTYERQVHSLLEAEVSEPRWKMGLAARAERIAAQLRPFLVPGPTLDYGCGDGAVGARLDDEEHPLTYADVVRLVPPHVARFIMLEPDRAPGLQDASFANLILCTVLHHADDPFAVIRECSRLTRRGGHVLVVESVSKLSPPCVLRAPHDPTTRMFLDLSVGGRIAANAFFDHLYNRCMFFAEREEEKINVPYNYLSPDEWNAQFSRFGLLVVDTVPLGVDLPIAPLFHTLHVCRRT